MGDNRRWSCLRILPGLCYVMLWYVMEVLHAKSRVVNHGINLLHNSCFGYPLKFPHIFSTKFIIKLNVTWMIFVYIFHIQHTITCVIRGSFRYTHAPASKVKNKKTNQSPLNNSYSATYPGSFGRWLRIHSSLHFKSLCPLVYNVMKKEAMERSDNYQKADQQYVTNGQKKVEGPGLRCHNAVH